MEELVSWFLTQGWPVSVLILLLVIRAQNKLIVEPDYGRIGYKLFRECQ